MTPLCQRMLEDMQVRRLSPYTQRTYVGAVARFARHFGALRNAWVPRRSAPTRST